MLIGSAATFRNSSLQIELNSKEILKIRPIILPLPFAWVILNIANSKYIFPALGDKRINILKQTLKLVFEERLHCRKLHFIRDNFIFLYLLKKDKTNLSYRDFVKCVNNVWFGRQPISIGYPNHGFGREIENSITYKCSDHQIFIHYSLLDSVKKIRIGKIKFKINSPIRSVELNSVQEEPTRRFQTFTNAVLVNGSYVIVDNSIMQIAPYETGLFDCIPQREPYRYNGNFYTNFIVDKVVDEPMLFVGSSANWYHFLIEILPRALVLFENKGPKLNIAINYNVPYQIQDLLFQLTGKKPFLVRDGESVSFKSLMICRDSTYPTQVSAFENLKNAFDERMSDIQLIQNWIRSLKVKEPLAGSKLIYLSRGNQGARRMKNYREVANLLSNFGFEEVNPSNLDFLEQISVIQNADVIVAEAGAALTNLIFCTGLKAVIRLEPEYKQNISKFWSDFAEILAIHMFTVYGSERHGIFETFESFTIPTNKLREVLEAVIPKA